MIRGGEEEEEEIEGKKGGREGERRRREGEERKRKTGKGKRKGRRGEGGRNPHTHVLVLGGDSLPECHDKVVGSL